MQSAFILYIRGSENKLLPRLQTYFYIRSLLLFMKVLAVSSLVLQAWGKAGGKKGRKLAKEKSARLRSVCALTSYQEKSR